MLTLQSIFGIENPQVYKVHAAGRDGEGQPLDVLVENCDVWLGRNRWRGTKDEFNQEFILSLIGFYPEHDTWLFGGIFRLLERRSHGDNGYVVELLDTGDELIGRLKVNWWHEPGPSLPAANGRNASGRLRNFERALRRGEISRLPGYLSGICALGSNLPQREIGLEDGVGAREGHLFNRRQEHVSEVSRLGVWGNRHLGPLEPVHVYRSWAEPRFDHTGRRPRARLGTSVF